MSSLTNLSIRPGLVRFTCGPLRATRQERNQIPKETSTMHAVSTSTRESAITESNQPNPAPGQKIAPFLWFDNQAEEAANFYVSIFKNARIISVVRNGDAGPGP